MLFLSTLQRLGLLVVLTGPTISTGQQFKTHPSYTLVNCCVSQGLTAYPFIGPAFTIPLPFVPKIVAFTSKGDSLYALEPYANQREGTSSIVKIEFHPTPVEPVWESIDLEILTLSVSVREDKLVVAGRRTDKTCGLFEISLPDGRVKKILERSDRCYGVPWQEISLSPDGKRAVARVGNELHLIDLVHGAIRILWSEFSVTASASWSPNGKQIAVMDGSGKIFLLDPIDLSPQRTLHAGYPMTPIWSFDSRYLIRGRRQFCGISFDLDPPFTLETVDVNTGKRSVIRSSKCHLQQAGHTGWLTTDLIY